MSEVRTIAAKDWSRYRRGRPVQEVKRVRVGEIFLDIKGISWARNFPPEEFVVRLPGGQRLAADDVPTLEPVAVKLAEAATGPAAERAL